MRTLLMLTYHFPPSAAAGTFRLLGFAQHLPRYDWRTVVVTPPSLPWEPVDSTLLERVPADTVVYPVPYPRHAPKVLRWAAQYSIWLWWARRAVEQAVREQRPDAVLTSGPPHMIHLLGRSLQRRYGLPWVADFRDPWITGRPEPAPQGWTRAWELFWERRLLPRANVVLANAPNAQAAYQTAYPRIADRIVTLTNGFDPELFPQCPTAPPSEEVRILHAGQIVSAGRSALPLLDALRDLPTGTRPIRLDFFGRTSVLNGFDLEKEIQQRNLSAVVRTLGQVSYGQALRAMTSADILLLIDSPGRRVGVPGKLYEYLGANRPIFALGEPDGDLAAILAASGMPHRIASPTDASAIRRRTSRTC